MADAADRATAQAEALEAVLLRRPVPNRPANAGLHCLTCGAEIPEPRRNALPGCCNCFDCQDEMERTMGR